MFKDPRIFKTALGVFATACIFSPMLRAQVQPVAREYSPTTPGSTNQTRASARNAATSTTNMVPEDFSKLVLAPGFLLDLQVYDMPEISSELRVDDAGNINVPLSGPVHVAGLALPAAQERIREKLVSAGILLHPRINLDVVQYAGSNVTVLGEVQSPGRLQLLAPHTLEDVLAMAGGETQLAGSTIRISHISGGPAASRTVHYDRKQTTGNDVVIEPGDTVVVPRAGIVYVLGGVNRPGGYLLQEDGTLDVAEAISVASGTTMDAAVGSMRVVRKDAAGQLATIPIPYRKITDGKEKAMPLRDGDILYVPISKFKTVLTAGISASASSALIYSVR